MDLQLAGKRVFITGASAGIGCAAADLFAGEGVTLALHGRRENALSDIASAIEAGRGERPHIVVGDLQDPAQCRGGFAKLGGAIDVLFNNAGASMPMYGATI